MNGRRAVSSVIVAQDFVNPGERCVIRLTKFAKVPTLTGLMAKEGA